MTAYCSKRDTIAQTLMYLICYYMCLTAYFASSEIQIRLLQDARQLTVGQAPTRPHGWTESANAHGVAFSRGVSHAPRSRQLVPLLGIETDYEEPQHDQRFPDEAA